MLTSRSSGPHWKAARWCSWSELDKSPTRSGLSSRLCQRRKAASRNEKCSISSSNIWIKRLKDALLIHPRQFFTTGPAPRCGNPVAHPIGSLLMPTILFESCLGLIFRSLSMKGPRQFPKRSEEHTSELQSLAYLVCRLLLEKKKKIP